MLGDGGAGEGGKFEKGLVYPLVVENVYNAKKCNDKKLFLFAKNGSWKV